MSILAVIGVLLAVGLGIFGLCLLVRRLWTGAGQIDTGPAAGVLSYVAAAFGILVGFVIVFLLGQIANARQAIGDEATSIGTAFDEAQLFPQGEPEIQHALICYSKAVTEKEWPAMADHRSAPEVDAAYRSLVATYGEVHESTDRTFQPAAATNSLVQIGNISTAREARLVTANAGLRPLMWGILIGGAVFLLVLLFVVSLPARPLTQAVLLGWAGVFSAVLLLLALVLGNPFRGGTELVRPQLIEQNTARMVALAPDVAAQPCPFEKRG